MYKITSIENEAALVQHYNALLNNLNSTRLDKYPKRDFSNVFEKYIRN
jgi:hypothetical protein